MKIIMRKNNLRSWFDKTTFSDDLWIQFRVTAIFLIGSIHNENFVILDALW